MRVEEAIAGDLAEIRDLLKEILAELIRANGQ